MIGLWQSFFILTGIYWIVVAAVKSNYITMIIGTVLFIIGAHFIK